MSYSCYYTNVLLVHACFSSLLGASKTNLLLRTCQGNHVTETYEKTLQVRQAHLSECRA